MENLFRTSGHSAALIKLHEAWHRSQLGDHTFKKDPVERDRVKRSMDYCSMTMNEMGELLSVADSSADVVRINFIRMTLDFENKIRLMVKNQCFPDLFRDSGNPLRLFYDFLDNLRTALVSEGREAPLMDLCTGELTWNALPVLKCCSEFRDRLSNTKFRSFADAFYMYTRSVELRALVCIMFRDGRLIPGFNNKGDWDFEWPQ